MTAVGFCELAALSRKVSGRPSAAGWSRIGKSARIAVASKVRGRVGAITAIVSLRGVTLRPPADGPSAHGTGFVFWSSAETDESWIEFGLCRRATPVFVVSTVSLDVISL